MVAGSGYTKLIDVRIIKKLDANDFATASRTGWYDGFDTVVPGVSRFYIIGDKTD